MEIKDIINSDGIILDMEVDSKDDFFKKITKYLKNKNLIENEDIFLKDLEERESIANTGFGDGLAIPHAKSKEAKDTRALYIRLKNDISWDSFDDINVKNIFLFVVNEKDAKSNYVDALASLARKVMDESFISGIINANKTEEILEIIRG